MSFEPVFEASSDEPVLSLAGLGKCYHIYDKPQHRLFQGLLRGRRTFHRDFWALRNVSLDVYGGEVVGVIGRNGSGKSTLLQLVCGTLTPTEGSVVTRGRVGALLELGAGFNLEFTGRENVYLNGTVLGLTQAQIDASLPSIAAFADIGQFIDQPVKTYSSGMFVRLAFAVIAHSDADVLIIDEALAVGDALFAQKCMRFLHAFRERGTILFVSHDTGAVLNLCDRAIWLQDGQVVAAGEAKQVVERYARWNMEQLQGPAPAIASTVGTKDLAGASAATPADGTGDEASSPGNLDRTPSAGGHDDSGLAGENDFGRGGAVIESVVLHRRDGTPTYSVAGGDAVTLRIRARATADVLSPIIGFHFKDRLGQIVFGENSFLTTAGGPLHLRRGERAEAAFELVMPFMKTGEYLFDVAFAEGTQALHVQHHWVYDALVVHVMTERPVFGLLSVPYTVSMRKTTSAADGRASAPAPSPTCG